MVIPTQMTPVQIHGGEVENDLKNQESTITDSSGQKVMHRWCHHVSMDNKVKLVLKRLEVYSPHVCTFSPGVTDILQMQCI